MRRRSWASTGGGGALFAADLPLNTTATAKEVVVHQGVEERDAVVGVVRESHAANLAPTGRRLTARKRATLTYRHAYRVTID